ncbi:galactosylceramide sulfotransferase [Chanos chanos]|uniref:Galactosylceramide sulfotransferase n=1 Tax=Chanos chanos TaxID=29144 RepID=A0A6J2UX42_CHACN|nr:galactosylceramide sulfotransferase-like [Chanos chanos]
MPCPKNTHVKSVAQKIVLGALLTCVMMVLYCLSPPASHVSMHTPPPDAACADDASRSSRRTFSVSEGTKEKTQNCEPKINVMFMKTHKTASSTLLNILFRFGQKHNLKFALPASRNDFFYPSPFFRSQVKDYKPSMCFNIVCNHMRFNGPEVEKLLPADTVFFTILRDPAELFESSFHYYRSLVPLTWKIRGQDKLTEFLNDPNRYFTPDSFNSFYLKNLQLFDFGYENNLEPQDPQVEKAIQHIAERFHLVLLAEYFEESLMLLKDALCWNMDDLLFFKLNARRGSSVSKLTPELRAKAREWNGADWKLYRHFNATFWAKVEAYGKTRMEKDVTELRRRNAEMAAKCIEGGTAVEAREIREQGMKPWQPVGESSILGYNLRTNISPQHQELCRKMLTPEIQYLTELGVNLWITKLWGWFKDKMLS